MKYRHRGYRDDEYDKERQPRGERREPREPRDPRDPMSRRRRRDLTPTAAQLVVRCHQCGTNVQLATDSVLRADVCTNCKADLHCCRNCAHFDPGARFECRQDIPERVSPKDTANDCAEYTPLKVLDSTGRRAVGPKTPQSARDAFDALFKK